MYFFICLAPLYFKKHLQFFDFFDTMKGNEFSTERKLDGYGIGKRTSRVPQWA